MDMFGGFSGAVIALCAIGVRAIVISLEKNPQAQWAARRNFPHAVQVGLVEEFSTEALRPVRQKRDVAAILVGGGAPCPGNTRLNRAEDFRI